MDSLVYIFWAIPVWLVHLFRYFELSLCVCLDVLSYPRVSGVCLDILSYPRVSGVSLDILSYPCVTDVSV
jgi:hypothetical protein